MKSVVVRHLVYFLIICLYITVIGVFDIGCPILYLIGIPCPTCGVTRAIRSLLKLDFVGYLTYHPFAVLMIASVMILLHGRIIKRKRLAYSFVGAILLLNTVFYIVRLIEML